MAIINDNSVEGAEEFRGVLSTSLQQVTIINSTLNLTILDDDEVCIKFNLLEYRASEEDGIATVWIRKEGLNDVPIHVTVTTEDGTATSKSHHVHPCHQWSRNVEATDTGCGCGFDY